MLLSKVHGVGAAKAHELVEKYEITSIEQLRERKDELLNHHQLIGIKYALKIFFVPIKKLLFAQKLCK